MTINILYGIRSTDLEQIKKQLEIALGVEFQRHESDYRGGDYFRCEDSSLGSLILQRNIDLIDGVPVVEGLSQWPILLYAYGLAVVPPIGELLSKYFIEYEQLQSKTSSDA